jgi:hypothetical protein
MKLKLGLFLAVVTSVVTALTVSPTASSATAIPISSTCTIAEGTLGATEDLTGTFTGTFTPIRFVASQGSLFLRGTLQGACTAVDPVVGSITQNVSEVVNILITAIGPQQTGSCQILDLTLGPLHLDLLGLVIDLNQVHLTITAVPGPGNLLGNLLCSIANLLNPNTVSGLAQTLNQLLRQGLITIG